MTARLPWHLQRCLTASRLFAMMAALAIAGCGLFEPQTEWLAQNRIVPPDVPGCGEEEEEEENCPYADLYIVDLHNDVLLWGRDIRKREDHGHSDLQRLRLGGTNLQVLSVPSHTPLAEDKPTGEGKCVSRDAVNTSALLFFANETFRPPTWFSDKSRVARQAERFRLWTGENGEGKPYFQAVASQEDIDSLLQAQNEKQPVVGAMLALEGLHWVGSDHQEVRSEVRRLASQGFRMIALTHRFTNALAESSEDCGRYAPREGLSDGGKVAVETILDEGLVLDLAHASSRTIADVTDQLMKRYRARAFDRPAALVMSHGGVRMTCNEERNLSEEDVRSIALAGGLIGLGYWPEAICWSSEESKEQVLGKISAAFVATYVAMAEESFQERYKTQWGEALDPVRYLALGSDYDGAVKMAFDASALPRLLQYMAELKCDELAKTQKAAFMRTGRCQTGGSVFSKSDIERIAGLNALELFRRAFESG